jgi:hypothetical protein
MIILFLSIIARSAIVADTPKREQQEKECMEHLRIIGEAIEAYKADHIR